MARTATKDPDAEVGVRTKLEFDKPKKGALTVTAYDKEWGPIACGVHNAQGTFDANGETDDYKTVTVEDEATGTSREFIERKPPAGFDPSCDDCKAQLESTLDHARRNATV